MGLLGNVAEVKALRRCLMTSQFVSVFADLLDTSSEGIEVLYREIEIGKTPATFVREEKCDTDRTLSEMGGGVNTDDMGRGVALLCNHPPSKHYSVFCWVSFIMSLAWHLSWDTLADASFPCDKAVSSGGHDKRD